MKTSPFLYGTTVTGSYFTNRKQEKDKLFNNLVSGINTVIISPRRWGKSSLVENVISDINKKDKNKKTVLIDMFSISNEEEFLETFAEEIIKASATKLEEWISNTKEFFKHIIPSINLGSDPYNDFSLNFSWNELKKNKNEILNLPETIAQKKNISFIISIDEFQNLATFSSYPTLEKAMRASWQRQQNVTYCIYGSKRHMMSDIFNNTSKPFYRFGDIIFLQKISTEHWVDYIVGKFEKTNKQISKQNAEFIAKIMENHSWYVQQLASYVWSKTSNKAEYEEILSALTELIYANYPFFQKEVEILSGTQLNLLKAIINNETQLTSTSTMNKYNLGTPRNVSKNITVLMNNDLIDKTDGHYEILDPAFKLWFLNQFYKKDFDALLKTI
jgi:hypothetical protein